MRILITGGSGLLGKQLLPLMQAENGDGYLFDRVYIDTPSHQELDITKEIAPNQKYDLIIHSAAYTDVVGAETNHEACFDTNVMGVYNLLMAYPDTPIVYISSEYAYKPVNYYSKTKLLGEVVVKQLAKRYFIIRTLFKPTPFPFPKAFVDQYTQGDYVDRIAPMIKREIMHWLTKDKSKFMYVGTGRKTIYDLAKRTRPDVVACSVDDIQGVVLPKDYE